MLYAVLEKKHIRPFLSNLIGRYEVVAPKKKGESFVFDRVNHVEEVALCYDTTLLPPKKLFLPPKETILEYKMKETPAIEADTHTSPQIVFGLHPCDIKGLNLLDMVFSYPLPQAPEVPTYIDPYWTEKRAHSVVIGLSCLPSPYCFCSSMEAEEVETGFDLFLIDIGDRYFLKIATADGDNLIRRNGRIKPVSDADFRRLREFANRRSKLFELVVERTEFPDFMDLAYQSKVWDQLGKKCLGCGACSYVCPTCYCMGVEDEVSLNLEDGRRFRFWQSCLLKEFGEIAGGFNFREDRPSRFKYRFYHKHKGFVEKYGAPACVGCGRCIRSCLAKINVVEVINTIRGEKVGRV